MPRWLLRVVVALPVLALTVFAGVSSGLVPVTASSGHWAITNWFLHYAMKRSVGTHARSLPEPKLDAPWLVLKGAGHYETGCRPCHGAPDLAPPVVPGAMTPHPPALSDIVGEWSARELMYVVKHGVKFTAMPAWPSQVRDDEVEAMVAFLRALPGLDARAYRRLVDGDTGRPTPSAPDAELVGDEVGGGTLAARCARCHGARGEGRGSAAFPKLAGQRSEYQIAALEAYARGARHSGIMQPIAAGLDVREMRALSAYYARLPVSASESEPARRERGRSIARDGIPAKGVPACAPCHGPLPGGRNAAYPRLAGQYADYLAQQLTLFRDDRRGGSPYAPLMRHVAARLDPEAMRDVAAYYAALERDDDAL
ncbi:MAG: c-type cytochrome [Polyangiales bacterium]